MILRKEPSVPIEKLALVLWTVVQVTDAYDSCDVRHRFMPETRKCYFFPFKINNLQSCQKIYVTIVGLSTFQYDIIKI